MLISRTPPLAVDPCEMLDGSPPWFCQESGNEIPVFSVAFFKRRHTTSTKTPPKEMTTKGFSTEKTIQFIPPLSPFFQEGVQYSWRVEVANGGEGVAGLGGRGACQFQGLEGRFHPGVPALHNSRTT